MRPWCEGCARPNTVCLCDVLPPPPGWPTRTRILILQHPHELKHKLATVPLLARCLPACQVVVGRRLHSTSSPLLPPPSPSHLPLLLFPGPHAQELGSWYAAFTSSQQLQEGIASAPLQVRRLLLTGICARCKRLLCPFRTVNPDGYCEKIFMT